MDGSPHVNALEETRRLFWERLGYVPGPDPKYQTRIGKRAYPDSLSLDYYDRLMGRGQDHGRRRDAREARRA
jgi:hypothetical protein